MNLSKFVYWNCGVFLVLIAQNHSVFAITLLDRLALAPTTGPLTVRSSSGTFTQVFPLKIKNGSDESFELRIPDENRTTRIIRYQRYFAQVAQSQYEICVHSYDPHRDSPHYSVDIESGDFTPDFYVLNFGGIGVRAELGMNPDLLARLPKKYRYKIWTVNYPGYGESSGPATLDTLGTAGRAAFDFLTDFKSNDTPILLVGQSMGTAVALSVATARSNTAGLFLRDVIALRELLQAKWDSFWNLWSVASCFSRWIPRDIDSVENAREINAKALFLTSEWDETAPPRSQKAVIENYSGEAQNIVLRGIGHETNISPDTYPLIDEAMEWLLFPSLSHP